MMEDEIDNRNAQHLANSLDIVRGYEDYVPDDELVGEPESDRFNKAVDAATRAILRMDCDDLEAFKEAHHR